MTDAKPLYDADFALWAQEQAAALRTAARGGNESLDWENLAEEIEDLGISRRHALRSQIRRIIRHLIKLEHSPARDPQRGWREAVNDAREEIRALLEASPSLRADIPGLIQSQLARGIRQAVNDLEEKQETAAVDLPRLRAATYREAQVLGDWFPPEPPQE